MNQEILDKILSPFFDTRARRMMVLDVFITAVKKNDIATIKQLFNLNNRFVDDCLNIDYLQHFIHSFHKISPEVTRILNNHLKQKKGIATHAKRNIVTVIKSDILRNVNNMVIHFDGCANQAELVQHSFIDYVQQHHELAVQAMFKSPFARRFITEKIVCEAYNKVKSDPLMQRYIGFRLREMQKVK